MSVTVCGGHTHVSENPARGREIQIQNREMTRCMPAEKVCYIESNNRKVILCTGQEKVECYGKIGELERELGNGFFRIHKGYLVNLRCIRQCGRTEVSMENGEILPVSKYKYRDFARAYQAFISDGGRQQGTTYGKEERHENHDTNFE